MNQPGRFERVALLSPYDHATVQGRRGILLECAHVVCFPKHGVVSEEIVKNYITSEFLIASLPGIAAYFPSEMRGNALDNAYLHNEYKKSEIFHEKRDTYCSTGMAQFVDVL